MRSRLTKDQELTIIGIAQDQIAKEDVIREMLSKLSRKELNEFTQYLFDPSKASEITHQEKTRFEKIIEDIRAAIEVSRSDVLA